jgi:hypothetical protein
MTMIRLAAAIVFVLLLVGCGSESNSSNAEQEPTSTAADCKPFPDASTSARLSPALEERETMFLTDVSVETTVDCADRVEFTFDEAEPGPGYNISYEPADTAKTEDGSGNPVEIDGSAFLVVRLTPAMTARIEGEDVKPTYTGPKRITPDGTRHAFEIVKTGDFEAMVTWVIGLDEQRPFSVNASSSQLIVEIS